MKLYQVLMVISCFLFAACSGSGRTPLGGQECPANKKPFSKNFDATKNKTVKKLEITDSLPDGEYKYLNGQLFYENDNGFEILVNDAVPKDEKEVVAKTACVRGFKQAKVGMGVTAPGISGMKLMAGAGKANEIEIKNFGFEMKPEGLRPSAKVDSAQKPVNVEKAYEAIDPSNKFILVRPGDIYEIYSFADDTKTGGHYGLKVRFHRTDITP